MTPTLLRPPDRRVDRDGRSAPVWDRTPEGSALEHARIQAGLSLPAAAPLLGLAEHEMAGLEAGTRTVMDWDDLHRRLREVTR